MQESSKAYLWLGVRELRKEEALEIEWQKERDELNRGERKWVLKLMAVNLRFDFNEELKEAPISWNFHEISGFSKFQTIFGAFSYSPYFGRLAHLLMWAICTIKPIY